MTPEEETFNRLKEPAPVIDEYGSKRWYNENGDLHRENDLPATVWPNGARWWYKNNILHRENGPAVILETGVMYWFEHGEPNER